MKSESFKVDTQVNNHIIKSDYGNCTEHFIRGYQQQIKKIKSEKRVVQADPQQLLFLFKVMNTDSLTIFEIASQIMITISQAKTLVKQLELKGLVTFRRSLYSDELVELTPKGKLYLKQF